MYKCREIVKVEILREMDLYSQDFDNLEKASLRKQFIFDGFVNITLFHGKGKDALSTLRRHKLHRFDPVWLYNFRFLSSIVIVRLHEYVNNTERVARADR